MSDLKPTVSLTSVNSENMSRHQMLDWVNNMVNGRFRKIEELCSGVAYCQMMEMISPNCINLKRVKMNAKLEHECFQNMKLFQGSLSNLKLDKTVPVDRLIKGRFQDNFEFLQWFKKFFESQAPGLENLKAAANTVQPKPIKPRAHIPINTINKEEQHANELKVTMDELNLKTTKVIEARDRAYDKLRQIELLLTDMIKNEQHVVFCNRVCEVLYKTDQDQDQDDQEEGPEQGNPISGNGQPVSMEIDIDDLNEGMY